jgi:allantoicase
MAHTISDPNAPDFTRRYENLADPRLGAQALERAMSFSRRRNGCSAQSRQSSFRGSTTITASGWTAGKRAASAGL